MKPDSAAVAVARYWLSVEASVAAGMGTERRECASAQPLPTSQLLAAGYS